MDNLKQRVIEILSSGLSRHDATSLNDLLEYVNQEFYSPESMNISPYTSMDCYRTVIHIYILFPTCVEVSILRKVLFACILNLPGQEFRECIQLLPSDLQFHRDITPLIYLDEALQSGNFATVWEMLSDSTFSDLLESPTCLESLRTYILEVATSSYYSLSINDMCTYLNITFPSAEFDKFVENYDWVVNSPTEGMLIINKTVSTDQTSQFNFKGNKYNTHLTGLREQATGKSFNADNFRNYYFNLKKTIA